MKLALVLVMAACSAALGTAQVATPPRARPFPPYVTQLGAAHFMNGEASRQDFFLDGIVLSNGDYLAVGYTYGSLAEPNAGNADIVAARFDPDGDLRWLKQIGAVTAATIPALNGDPSGPGGHADGNDVAQHVCLSGDAFYVSGTASGSLGETNAGGTDAFLAKFSLSGSLLWLHQIGVETAALVVPPPGATTWGDASRGEGTGGVRTDAAGQIYFCGHTAGNLGEDNGSSTGYYGDIFVASYDPAGHMTWLRQLGAISSQSLGFDPYKSDGPTALELQPSGDLVVVGNSGDDSYGAGGYRIGIWTFSALGSPTQFQIFMGGFLPLEWASGLALDGSGAAYIVGSTLQGIADVNLGIDTQDILVVKYSPTLQLQWVQQIGANAAAQLGLIDVSEDDDGVAIRVDPIAGVLITGQTRGSLNEQNGGVVDVFTANLRTSDGALNWVSQVGQTTAALAGLNATSGDYSRSLSLGPQGTLCVCGGTSGSFREQNGGFTDLLVMRLSKLGKPY